MARTDLFVTDLDGTLLGDADSLEQFTRWWRLQNGRMRLVYASGRFCDSVETTIRDQHLPAPDAIIGGVGTEIRMFPRTVSLGEWGQNWRPLWDAKRVRETLAAFPELAIQPQEFQSEFKTSCYAYDATQDLLDGIRLALAKKRIPAELIYSSNRDLDVVPYGVNKGAAAMFLAHRWRLDLRAVIVAGDSGNDRSLFQPFWRGIVVANAHLELASLARPSVYFSKHPFAAGVLDGMRHWLGTEFHQSVA